MVCSSLARAALALALSAAIAASGAQEAPRPSGPRPPNELGRIPVLVYHTVGEVESRWQRARAAFRADLELLYARGYRPISISDLVDRRIDLPAGLSPVIVTFDDASPSQFSYIDRGGVLEIDPNSAVGIWLVFAEMHPGWRNRAVFCVLTAADAGHSLFGDRGIDGQRTEWRHRKVRHLVELGFEMCGHTQTHSNLATLSDAGIHEQIGRGLLAIDSAVPGHRVRTFALPYGTWPANRDVVLGGSWRDPRSGHVIDYRFDAILEGWGGTVPSPFAPSFDPFRLRRVQVTGTVLEQTLDWLDEPGRRYISDGDPATVAIGTTRPSTH
ncbi:MAG TPA: polysaccharide deacetylase family protein [Gemmatimonadaceae bacterium]|jgi:hypothetical protein